MTLSVDVALQRLHAQYEIARALAESRSLTQAAPQILRAICQTLDWEYGGLWRVDAAARLLRCVDTWHAPSRPLPEFETASRKASFEAGVGLPGRVWETAAPAWIPDVVVDENFPRAPIADREGLHAALGFPILARTGVVGVLEFFSREIREPDTELLELLATIGSQIGQFAERSRAEADLATLFQLSRDMLCIADFEGYFRTLNPAWERTLGFTEEELRSRPYLDFVHPDDRESTLAEAGKLAEGSRVVLFENRYLCKDGSYRWLSWNSTPLEEQGLVYCTVRDVTQERMAATALREARQAADAANRAKSDFLANMSHEIRTPMNAVIGMAELLLNTPLGPEQREHAVTLKDAAESLLGLIDDVLDFSKIEAGMLELHPEPFELRELLGNTLKTLGLRAHQKELELACRIAPEVPESLIGDGARLRQVVVNLVGNAIKFTERGEVLLEVEREAADADGVALGFLVSDTGIGIPRAKQERVFGAFAQADGSTTRQYGGTGLGLSIAARLVSLMGGGKIAVESEPGRGSRFRFGLRFGLPPAASPTTRTRSRARLGGLRVLVVDDNATNRRILEELLRHWRMRPTVASGAEQAIGELERAARSGRPYRLVLLDAAMPGTDGFAVAERIRASPELAGASIMMLSSSARHGERARCQELGVAAYLTKPVKHSDLLDRISAVLDGPEPERAGARGTAVCRRLRVLVAEDNAVNQQVAVGMLQQAGHSAVVAADGREALAAMEREAFDLVLMDVRMPKLDGFETTAAIRASERTGRRRTPIVAVTADAMQGDAERCLAAGMDAHLAKPLQTAELLATVESLAGEPRQAGAGPEPGTRGAVDETRLLERVGGDRRALGQLVRLFLDDCPKLLARIRTAISSGDAEALQAAAHTLKGAVSNFAAPGAIAAALHLQQIGAAGGLSEAPEGLRRLEAELEQVRDALARLAPARTRNVKTRGAATGRRPR